MTHLSGPPRQSAIDRTALDRRLEQLHTTMGDAAGSAHSMPRNAAPPRAGGSVAAAGPAKADRATAILIGSAVLVLGALWWAYRAGTRTAAAPATQAALPPAPMAPSISPPARTRPSAEAQVDKSLDEQRIRDLLENWRLDWSRRDVDAYLAHYDPAFVPAGGQTRAEWAASRRQNILRRPAIRIEVNDLRIEQVDEKQVRLSFRQNYLSGTYQETALPKTLLLLRGQAGWRIAGEWQGQEPGTTHKTP